VETEFIFKTIGPEKVLKYSELLEYVEDYNFIYGSFLKPSILKGGKVNLIVGDFNGDGQDDIIRQENNFSDNSIKPVSIYSGGRNYINDLGKLTGEQNDFYKGDMSKITTGDFNGDGKDDFIHQESRSSINDLFDNNIYNNIGNLFLAKPESDFSFTKQTSILNKIEYSIISNFGSREITRISTFDGNFTNLIVGDFNGDGKDDFIRQEYGLLDDDSKNTANLWLSNGSNFSRIGELGFLSGFNNEDFKGDFTNLIVGDFNGDGKDDFIRQEKGTHSEDDYLTANLFFATSENKFIKVGELGALSNLTGDPFKGGQSRITAGDFNGDLLCDFLVQTDDLIPDLYFSLLDSFGKISFKSMGKLKNYSNDMEPILISPLYDSKFLSGDLDGNGFSDLIKQDLPFPPQMITIGI